MENWFAKVPLRKGIDLYLLDDGKTWRLEPPYPEMSKEMEKLAESLSSIAMLSYSPSCGNPGNHAVNHVARFFDTLAEYAPRQEPEEEKVY